MAQFSDPNEFQITYEILRDLEQEWSCQLESELSSTAAATVFLVKMRETNEMAVVKFAQDFAELALGAQCLDSFGEDLAVKIIDMSAKHHAILMEHITPGRSLRDLAQEGEDNEATRILKRILMRLRKGKFEVEAVPSLYDKKEDFDLLTDRIPKRMLHRGKAAFEKMCKGPGADHLLHGDLHHGNVIESETGWRVIDAKGFAGPAIFESAAMMRNPEELFFRSEDVSIAIERRLTILSGPDYYPRSEIIEAALCGTLLSMAWNLEDHGRIPQQDHLIAEYLESRL